MSVLRRRLKEYWAPVAQRLERLALYQETYWRQRFTRGVDEQDYPAFTIWDQGYILDAITEPRPKMVFIPSSRRDKKRGWLKAVSLSKPDSAYLQDHGTL